MAKSYLPLPTAFYRPNVLFPIPGGQNTLAYNAWPVGDLPLLTRRKFIGSTAVASVSWAGALAQDAKDRLAPQVSARALAMHRRGVRLRRARARARSRVLLRWQYGRPEIQRALGSSPSSGGVEKTHSSCLFMCRRSIIPAALKPGRHYVASIMRFDRSMKTELRSSLR